MLLKKSPNRESAIINIVMPDENNRPVHLFDFIHDIEAERENMLLLIQDVRMRGGYVHSISRFNLN